MTFNIYHGNDNVKQFRKEAPTSVKINDNLLENYDKGYTISTFIHSANLWCCVWAESREEAVKKAKELLDFGSNLDIKKAYIHCANGHEFHNISLTNWYLSDVIEVKEEE